MPNNVFYHGPFKNPDELLSIYSSIDICYVVYDSTDGNVKLAIPNKLYECLFFLTPMIVAKGTYLAERVKELQIGFEVDIDNGAQELELIFSSITTQMLKSFSMNAAVVKTDVLIDDGDLFVSNIMSNL